jgi:hypothetical protein
MNPKTAPKMAGRRKSAGSRQILPAATSTIVRLTRTSLSAGNRLAGALR